MSTYNTATDVPESDTKADFVKNNNLPIMDILTILALQRELRIYIDKPIDTGLIDNIVETVAQTLDDLDATRPIFSGVHQQQGVIVCDVDVNISDGRTS